MTDFVYTGSNNIISNNIRIVCKKIIPFIPFWVTPNMITFLGNMPYLFAYSNKSSYLILFITHVLQWICDDLDGEYARHMKKTSFIGAYFDHGFDIIWTNIFSYFVLSEILGDEDTSIIWFLSITFKYFTFLNQKMIKQMIVPNDIDVFRFLGAIYLFIRVLFPYQLVPLIIKIVFYYYVMCKFFFNNLQVLNIIYKNRNKIQKFTLLRGLISFLLIISVFSMTNKNFNFNSNETMFKLGQSLTIIELYNISNFNGNLTYSLCLCGALFSLINKLEIYNIIVQFCYFFFFLLSF